MTNTGKKTVIVDAIRTSCACTSVSPQAFELAPGDSKSLTLNLDLVDNSSRSKYAFNVQLFPFYAGEMLGTIDIEANVINPLVVSQEEIYLQYSELAPFPSLELPIQVVDTTATDLSVDASNRFVEITINPVGEGHVMAISPSIRKPGVYTTDIVLKASYPDGLSSQRRLTAIIECESELNARPQEFVLGHEGGHSAAVSNTVALSLKSGSEFRVHSHTVNAKSIAISCIDEKVWSDSFTFTATSEEMHELSNDATLEIEAVNREGKRFTIAIPIRQHSKWTTEP